VRWVAEPPSPFFMVHGSEASYPRTSTTTVHEYEPTPRKATRSHLRTRSTSSMRRETWHSYVVPSTNKPYDATTSAMCALASSKSETWSFDEFKAVRIDTSCHPLRRGRSLPNKCSDSEHTRFDTRTDRSSPTHGTSNICGHFTLE
jgi:hypothetical protein